jgi:hypothetical protein
LRCGVVIGCLLQLGLYAITGAAVGSVLNVFGIYIRVDEAWQVVVVSVLIGWVAWWGILSIVKVLMPDRRIPQLTPSLIRRDAEDDHRQAALEAAEAETPIEEPYKGYANYPTWFVHDLLTSRFRDELEEGRAAVELFPEHAAKFLRGWVTGKLSPDDGGPSATVMATLAMVDWQALADEFLAQPGSVEPAAEAEEERRTGIGG